MANKKTVYISDQAERIIGNDDDRGYLSNRINSIVMRYGAICKRDCPEMTKGEWMACCDVLSSTVRENVSDSQDIARFLWVEIQDAEQDGLGKKWGIECKAFAGRIKKMPYSSQCSIVEVASKFWLGHNGPIEDSDQQLELAGARVKTQNTEENP